MRARLTAIVLSILVSALTMLLGAFVASAATPTGSTTDAGWYGTGDALAAPAVTGGRTLAAEEPSENLHGSLTYRTEDESGSSKRSRVAVPDVVVTVSQDGEVVGTATSDEDGEWEVELPGPGTYDVEVDPDTLPPGVTLADTDKNPLTGLLVKQGKDRTATFKLVEGGGIARGSQVSYVISMALAGLRYGLIIAMTAIGLSLIFGTTGLINFAHGEIVTVGAVVAYVFGTAPLRWPFAIAIAITVVLLGALGGALELGLWRPLRRRGTGLIQMFIISIGLALLIRHSVLFFFGASRKYYIQAGHQQAIRVGAVEILPRDLTVILISIVVLISIGLMLQRTRMGKAMRALADNRDLAEASGINVERVTLQVWILGGGLAGLGGIFLGLTTAVHWNMGWYLLLLMFAGVILGGLGSAYGAIVGSLVIGIVAQMSSIWFSSQLQNAWAMLVLIVVLLIRPQGLFGRLQRAG